MSKRQQCQLLGLNRSSLYYKPTGDKPEDLKLMRIMDEEYLDHPTTGVLGMVEFLRLIIMPA
jgi:putative transposase